MYTEPHVSLLCAIFIYESCNDHKITQKSEVDSHFYKYTIKFSTPIWHSGMVIFQNDKVYLNVQQVMVNVSNQQDHIHRSTKLTLIIFMICLITKKESRCTLEGKKFQTF